MTLTNSTVTTARRAYAEGGGIYGFYVRLIDSTVSENRTAGGYALGGGITRYRVTLTDSTVSGNRTGGDKRRMGGGMAGFRGRLTDSSGQRETARRGG